MKTAEIREMTVLELRDKEHELEDEIFRLKIKRFTAQLDNKMVIRMKKKELARVKTIINEKVKSLSSEHGEVGK